MSHMKVFLVLAVLAVSWIATPMAFAETAKPVVIPIDWSQFSKQSSRDEHLVRATELMQNCARYTMQWAPKHFKTDEAGPAYILPSMNESGIRPACSTVYGMGVLLKTGGFDEKQVGITKQQATRRTAMLLRGIVGTHQANHKGEKTWGNSWQSALWAALSGFGGWTMWDDLDGQTQQQLVKMVVQEADRFIEKDYKVPYWNGIGGDTKAEENAWNSMILNLAVAMMPEHPRAAAWRERCIELMISSYATERDWKENKTVIDGRAVKDWLRGYNTRPDGMVLNHGFVHPDYMVVVSMNFWGLTAHSLARQPIPEAWDFNGRLIYQTCVSKSWKAPPYRKPGGTIYIPGKPQVYYPQGTDWSTHDYSLYYLLDSYANRFGWSDQAAGWQKVRADKMLEMQKRHADRRMFAKGEYDTYSGSEQLVFWCITDAYLPQWLAAHDRVTSRRR